MSRTRKSRSKSGRTQGRREIQLGLGILLALLAMGLYLNTLGHDFVFDDATLILQNPLVTSLDWTGIAWRSGYRPVRSLTYALNYAVSGENAFSYHLVNVVLHGANVFLLFRLLILVGAGRPAAGVATLLFACHPAQTAAVAYISGRKDLLATFFILLGLSIFQRYRTRDDRRGTRLLASGLLFLLAFLSKEVAVVFPGLLLLIDGLRVRREGAEDASFPAATWRAVRESPLLYGGFAALAASGLYWVMVVAPASRMEEYWGGTFWTNLGTSFKLFVHYLKLSVVPYPLLADYLGAVFPVSTGFAEPATLASVLALAAFAGVAVWIYRAQPLLGAGMLWFLGCLIPVLQFHPFHELAADHFLYLPLVGWSLAVGTLASLAVRKVGTKAVAGAVAVVAVVFAGLTLDRNGDWKDRKTLWEATYQQAPDSYRANANLGQIYFNEGRFEEAIELTERSIEVLPERALGYANLGAMYQELAKRERIAGNLERAEEYYDEAARLIEEALLRNPRDPFTYNTLAVIYKERAFIYDDRGETGMAMEARQKALELFTTAFEQSDPRKEVQRIWHNYAGVLIDAGYYRDAVPPLRRLLRAYPDDLAGNYWLGYCLYEIGREEEAIQYLERVIGTRPTPEILTRLAGAYEAVGRLDDAVAFYRRLVNRNPSAGVHYRLARLQLQKGELAEARRHLGRAMALDSAREYSDRLAALLERIESEARVGGRGQ